VSAREDGSYAVEGDATEARGTGSVKLALTLWVREAEEGSGSTVRFEGTATADGRVAEFPAEAVGSAVGRLLNRFGEQLGVVAEQDMAQDTDQATDQATDSAAGQEKDADEGLEGLEDLAPGEFETRVTSDFETTPDADDDAAPEPDVAPAPAPRAPEPEAGGTVEAGAGAGADAGAGAGEPPVAEAAHARRTMIGRSAEEVDHAPPRGRYAPVPAPQTVVPGSALRWAAPAAAVVLASAIVVSRVIRRRR
jgi:hypothetical protein